MTQTLSVFNLILIYCTLNKMTFQLRAFKKINYEQFNLKEELTDIYIFKKDSPFIGVKFRNLQQKKYGFKIRSVELKLCSPKYLSGQGDLHKKFQQEWIKFRVQFRYRLYSQYFYTHKKLFQDKLSSYQKKQQSQSVKLNSFQDQLQHLNLALIKNILEEIKFDTKIKTKYPQFDQWLNEKNPICQLYILNKNKIKTQYMQTGFLNVQPMLRQIKQPLIFQTVSFQSQNKDKISKFVKKSQKKWMFKLYSIQPITKQINNLIFEFNISYPQLLEDIYDQYTTN